MDNRTLSSKGWRCHDPSQQVGMTGEPSLSFHIIGPNYKKSVNQMYHVQNVYILPGAYHPGGHKSKGPPFLQGNSEVIREIFEINMI